MKGKRDKKQTLVEEPQQEKDNDNGGNEAAIKSNGNKYFNYCSFFKKNSIAM